MDCFRSKAETLETVRRRTLKGVNILPLYYFSFAEWKRDKYQCLENIFQLCNNKLFVVRSSSRNEDKNSKSNAGAFLSLLNVGEHDLIKSINRVFRSYKTVDDTDLVLVQPMLQNVVSSGVAFSHDQETGAPYKIISWTLGKETDGVTSGEKRGKTLLCHHAARMKEPKEIKGISALLDELRAYFGDQPLDIEFAFSNRKGVRKLWLLQVRPLVVQSNLVSLDEHEKKLVRIEQYLNDAMRRNPFLKGKTTAFGVMPDWNPAEIIGLRPRPLAKSLYRDLITNSIWAYQRNNYGYRNLRGFPLMGELEGLPYIDTRISFNSFIPQEIEGTLAEKLVNYYQKKLVKQPFLHDKVEFNIVYSCYTLDIEDQLKKLPKDQFSSTEIDKVKSSLLALTNRILNPNDGLMISDAKRIIILKDRRELVMKSEMTIVQKIYWLIEDAKRYGTLPFAGLARAGFIAIQLLNSLVAKKIITNDEMQHFLSSIRTVSTQMSEDLKSLSLSKFLENYGHLRPGTYDILSPRYDEDPKLYFNHVDKLQKEKDKIPFRLSIDQMKSIDSCLKTCGLEVNAIELFSFIEDAISLRESSKFEFTKNLSDSLSLIGLLGKELGLSLSDMSFTNIEDIKQLYSSSSGVAAELIRSMDKGKNDFMASSEVFLPPLITQPSDVWQFCPPDIIPNYITQKIVTGHIVDLKDKKKLKGAIVCIPSADPGYDWLFSHSIGGLVTAWGGINSHMAIRAGEMGVPAIIGAGEKIFDEFKSAAYVRMDCESKGYEVIR